MSVSNILPATASKTILSGMAGPSAMQRENGDFAKMLSQREAEHVAEKAPVPAPQKAAEKTPEARREAEKSPSQPEKPREKTVEERRAAQQAGAKSGAKPAGKTQDAAAPDDADVSLTALSKAGKSAHTEAAEADVDGPAPDKAEGGKEAAPVDWVAALQLPPQAPPDAASAAGRKGGPGDDDLGGAASGAGKGKGRGQGGAEGLGQQDLLAAGASQADAGLSADETRLQAQSGHEAAAWQGALSKALEPGAEGGSAASDRAGASAIEGASALVVAGLANAPTGASAPTAPAAPPAVLNVPTPADSPEFPQALGAQISVLAKDGIQQAELHLNPADMGPISVQIDLQGNQAQVDFGADSAQTRQIIENGLPELAAALRDAGFTLSGGGVHQQARGARDGGDGSGRQGGPNGRAQGAGRVGQAAEEPAPAAGQRIQARVSAGGVDLYA